MRGWLAAALAAAALAACDDGSGALQEIERIKAERAAWRASIASRSPDWLAEKRSQPGAVTTESGLVYVTTTAAEAGAARPLPRQEVRVHYEGKLLDGTVFDSSFERGQPAEFFMEGLVPGFAEMLSLMQVGQEVTAYLPAELAYGRMGAPPDIPPNAALEFRIQLLAINPNAEDQ